MNNRECENCTNVMTIFTSIDEKIIYMCPYCGSIYIPRETKSDNIQMYESSWGNFIGTKCYDLPTQKQMSYLKYLTKELNYEVDLSKIKKYEAGDLITKLKYELDVKKQTNYVITRNNSNIDEDDDCELPF